MIPAKHYRVAVISWAATVVAWAAMTVLYLTKAC